MQKPLLSNVTGTGQLCYHSPLDLQFIASKVEGSRLNTRKFPGLIIRKIKPKGTIILFRSCKFLVIGSDSPENCQIISRKLVKDLQKILCTNQIKPKIFRIANLMASANLGFPVNVNRIAQLPYAFKDDKHSGVFLRLINVKSVLIFESGKVILNGTTKYEFIQETFDRLLNELKQFEIKNEDKIMSLKNKQEKIVKSKRERKPKNTKKIEETSDEDNEKEDPIFYEDDESENSSEENDSEFTAFSTNKTRKAGRPRQRKHNTVDEK